MLSGKLGWSVITKLLPYYLFCMNADLWYLLVVAEKILTKLLFIYLDHSAVHELLDWSIGLTIGIPSYLLHQITREHLKK
jgi:hypothetical protein